MTKVEDKGCPNYNKFDLLDTAVLEAILRADFDAPEAEQIDAEEALYIANLLAERRNVEHKDVETSLKDFFEYYYPIAQKGEGLYSLDDDTDAKNKEENNNIHHKNSQGKVVSFVQKGWRRFSSAVAVLLLFMFIGTATAYALGYDPIGIIGKWNDEHFWLEKDIPTKELCETVAVYSDEKFLVPKWLPAGYVSEDINISELDSYIAINADFYKENTDNLDKLYIDYIFLSDNDKTPLYEKDIKDVEAYRVHNINYYIMENLGKVVIVWRNGNVEGSIKGEFSLAEAKQIINSIYEE